MANPEPVTIVIIEDDAGHARLIEKNIRRCNITNNVLILKDGREASDYLFCEGECADGAHPTPLMVLLDLKLPKVHGLQILERMKAGRRTRSTPVVVLTSTDDKREVDRCYELGCNVFITKPLDYEQFSEAIRKLGLFLSVVTLPGEDEDR